MKNGPYELVIAPLDYPGKRYRGRYCYEHHLVYWQHYGVLPGPDELIHHRDENKRNNAIDNLELKGRSRHTTEHNTERPRDPVPQHTCKTCRKIFQKHYKGRSYPVRFCSRKCIGASVGRSRTSN